MAKTQELDNTSGDTASPQTLDVTGNGSAPAGFNWDELPEPLLMPDKDGVASDVRDAVKDTPAPIRMRIELQLAVNAQRKAAAAKSTAKRPRVDYDWRVQPVPDAKAAKEFVDYLGGYAKYRPDTDSLEFADVTSPRGQVTVRNGDPAWYVTSATGKPLAAAEGQEGAWLGVRYSARPFEGRSQAARLPGTTG